MKQTDRLGVHAVEGIVLKDLGWIFREQTVSDWGIDAHIEIVDSQGPTGRLIALQIKSGRSFFRKKTGHLVYHGKRRHLGYWTRHSLPVLIVLHNPDTDETVWQRVNYQDVQSSGYDKWSIEIPRTQVLNADAKEALERGVSDISAQRRIRLSLDLGLMREFAKHDEIYLRIEEWPNKSLGIRGMEVFFEELEGKPDYTFGIFVPDHNFGRFMEHYWPWLDFEYVNEPDLSGFSAATDHDLNASTK